MVFSCEKSTKQTMTISGNIKGLKKGRLFLQQFTDSSLVNLDSLDIKGTGEFNFTQELNEPDVFYLYLKKEDNNDVNDRIMFFGEPGEMVINTRWNTFDLDPEVLGSASHDKYLEFSQMLSRFNVKEFELAQLTLDPKYQEDSLAMDSIQKRIDQNIVNRYRYAINFGLNNGDSYVTPYAMVTTAFEANPKYLDSVYKMLTPPVAESKYGRALKALLEK